VGNFPQAFSHLTLVLAAQAIATASGTGAAIADPNGRSPVGA
jgi:hypothetical protein